MAEDKTPEYFAWQNMIQRCTNKKFKQYADYGGRGIQVHSEWLGRGGYRKFLDHVGRRPGPKYTLDRRNNDLGYVPGNVRWATRTEQNRNTSKNVYLTVEGTTKTLSEWSIDTGVGHSTLRDRLARGWPPEKIISPVRSRR